MQQSPYRVPSPKSEPQAPYEPAVGSPEWWWREVKREQIAVIGEALLFVLSIFST